MASGKKNPEEKGEMFKKGDHSAVGGEEITARERGRTGPEIQFLLDYLWSSLLGEGIGGRQPSHLRGGGGSTNKIKNKKRALHKFVGEGAKKAP